ncbi:AMP-dependent synthetase/ligase [Penicillium cf. griseofulvum]|uniref:AMP-dependent synthetase/ligase n=1 Tax=Penicillium cf. griseofulvum TaxID=2972120 RepID=A0A9W9MUC2_9EURO|nr:AMP-dependent synthetase/ligase [Penicillium cf. griseofulvum]KAJ5445785.1 AMP-dependent synthetase/ligase [Penicillium cf. griseofulvum]KAJ5447507.1 AMP-dependent synthetase/ligase [Penicillium cf. griseofulvum]
MIFEPAERILLPTRDLLSYIFDEPTYDQDQPIYIDVHNPTRSISCNLARKLVRQLIAGLRESGFQKGDCVLIHSFNDISYSILVLAIIGAGGVYTGSNPSYTPHELTHHIRASESKFLFSEPEILDSLLRAAEEVNLPKQNVWVFDNLGQSIPDGMPSWKQLLEVGEDDWVRFNDLETCRQTTAARLFSSGTTGLPKAVTITHHNLIAQHEAVYGVNPRPYSVSRVIAVPVFHASAAPVTHISTLKAGAVVYMMRRFDLETYLTTVDKYNITDIAMVPPIVIAILMSPLSQKKPFLKKIRMAGCGAAPLDKNVQARFRSLMGGSGPFTQVWGMTETSCVATMFPYPEHDDTGSVGRLLPNLEAKLIDENGENISAFDVRGELCVRGPTVTPGYFNNPEANAESFDAEGWFKTGDIAYCDQRTRKWYIVDRRKELIKVRGFQVAPPELEAALLSHPQIVDAGVIGITFPGADTEYPRAYVVRRPGDAGSKVTEAEIQEYVLSRLAKYKALTGGVKFVGAISRNPSGKILKRVLREDAKKEIEAGLLKAKL